MDTLIFSLSAVLPLFFFIVLGFLLRRFRVVDDAFLEGANKLGFQVLLPVLLFYNLISSDMQSAMDMRLISFAVVGIILIALIMIPIVIFYTKDNRRRGVLIQCVMRSNYVLFGVAMAQNMFGMEGAGPASLLVAVVIPVFNVMAIIALSLFSENKKKGRARILSIIMSIITNPLIISTIVGLLFAQFNLSIPTLLRKPLADLAALASPIALIALGGRFQFNAVRKNLKDILFGVVGKLIVSPVIFLSIAVTMGFRGPQLGALLALFGSPVAVSSYSMALQAGADDELAGQLVVFTTLFSLLSIFFFVFALRSMGFL